MVVDDHAAVAVQDFAARRGNGQGLDAVALGLLVVYLGILDLQAPEAGDQKQEDEDAGVLEHGDFSGGEFDVFAARLCAGLLGLMLEFRTDRWRVHGAGDFPYLVYQDEARPRCPTGGLSGWACGPGCAGFSTVRGSSRTRFSRNGTGGRGRPPKAWRPAPQAVLRQN